MLNYYKYTVVDTVYTSQRSLQEGAQKHLFCILLWKEKLAAFTLRILGPFTEHVSTFALANSKVTAESTA